MTERNIAILAGIVAALAAVVGGVFSYTLGRTNPQPPIIIQVPTQK
jgi:membrane protein YqaA with SNARE-associated domain